MPLHIWAIFAPPLPNIGIKVRDNRSQNIRIKHIRRHPRQLEHLRAVLTRITERSSPVIRCGASGDLLGCQVVHSDRFHRQALCLRPVLYIPIVYS